MPAEVKLAGLRRPAQCAWSTCSRCDEIGIEPVRSRSLQPERCDTAPRGMASPGWLMGQINRMSGDDPHYSARRRRRRPASSPRKLDPLTQQVAALTLLAEGQSPREGLLSHRSSGGQSDVTIEATSLRASTHDILLGPMVGAVLSGGATPGLGDVQRRVIAERVDGGGGDEAAGLRPDPEGSGAASSVVTKPGAGGSRAKGLWKKVQTFALSNEIHKLYQDACKEAQHISSLAPVIRRLKENRDRLDLSNMGVGRKGGPLWDILPHLPPLEDLRLKDCRLTDACIEKIMSTYIEGSPGAEEQKLKNLDLSHNRIRAAAAVSVGRFAKDANALHTLTLVSAMHTLIVFGVCGVPPHMH